MSVQPKSRVACDEETWSWLLAGDPSIRWQAMQDLGNARAAEVSRERARVASEGWGARLLALQAPDGQWADGLYRARGREFFLRHSLYRSHRTGRVADSAFTRFPFPPQWHFDVLRGLEHFRSADAPRDERLQDAVDVISRAQQPDGRWPVHRPYPGRQWFPLETAGPSRWATLRSLRVLRWWHQ